MGNRSDRPALDLIWLLAGIALLAAVAPRTYPRKAV